MADETLKIRFLDFVFRWWPIFSLLTFLVVPFGIRLFLIWIFGSKSVVPLCGYVGSAIVLLVLSVVVFYKYRKWRYGIGWGEGEADITPKDTYPDYNDEPPSKALVYPLDPDGPSDQETLRLMERVREKRRKKK